MGQELHGNGSFLVSLSLVGASEQSQGKAVNVQYGTQHPPRSTTEYSLRQKENKKENI